MDSFDECSFCSSTSWNNAGPSDSTSRPQSSLASQLEKNCQCRNCTIGRGLGNYRPLSAATIKSIDVDATLPGASCSAIENSRPKSASVLTEKTRTQPIDDCVWAWDNKYVEQKTSVFPWLPSGSLPRYCPYLKKLGKDKSYSKTTVKTLGYFVWKDITVQSPFHKKRKSEPPISTTPTSQICKRQRCQYQPDTDKDVDDWARQIDKKPNPDLCSPIDPQSFDPCAEEMAKLTDNAECSLREMLKMGTSSMCPSRSPTLQQTRDGSISREQKLSCAFLAQVSPSPKGSVRPASSPVQPSEKNIDSLLARECHMRVISFDATDGVFYPGRHICSILCLDLECFPCVLL